MANFAICGTECGTRVIVSSFVEGGRIQKLAPPKPRTDDDAILAQALYIQRTRGKEEAELFLDLWALRQHPANRN